MSSLLFSCSVFIPKPLTLPADTAVEAKRHTGDGDSFTFEPYTLLKVKQHVACCLYVCVDCIDS